MEEHLVTLATDHYTAAEVLKARLESNGINVFLKHVNLLQGAVSEGVKVQIKASDVEQALRLMAEWKSQQDEIDRKSLKGIRRILVPVDFSEYSKNACLFALNLAKKYDAEIKLLHVYYAPIVDMVPITDAYSIQIDMDINLRELEGAAKKNLLAFMSEVRDLARENGFEGVKIGYSLREGITGDEISHSARDYKPGIIIMGSKGNSDKQSDIIGSVVYKVLDRTNIPVLVIPQNCLFDIGSGVKNIVYATDFDDSDFMAIRKLMAILSAFNVKIHCVHVSRDIYKTWSKAKMDALRDYFGVIHKETKIFCHLLEGEDLVRELESFTQTHRIDLFALTSRKRNLLFRMFKPGLTKKLIYQSRVPLLIFRA